MSSQPICVDERVNVHIYEYTLIFVCACVTLSVRNSAVTAWISGPDMVEWLQGELLPLPFSLTEAIFHSYGTFKVKQTTLENSLCFQHNNRASNY